MEKLRGFTWGVLFMALLSLYGRMAHQDNALPHTVIGDDIAGIKDSVKILAESEKLPNHYLAIKGRFNFEGSE